MYKFDHIEKVGVDEMVLKGTKTIYNIDNGITASKWVRKEVKGKKANRDLPKLSSALETM